MIKSIEIINHNNYTFQSTYSAKEIKTLCTIEKQTRKLSKRSQQSTLCKNGAFKVQLTPQIFSVNFL